LAGAVVAIAHSLQLTTVTEGIETTAQLAAMQRLGCTHFQGYLWAPPVPASDFLAATSAISAQTMPRPRGAGPLRVVHGGRPVT
jgi:EAL domain-containing protein (putative c-di-GMP-specific phosphodiesterase class I)